jgi:hypothetical protein
LAVNVLPDVASSAAPVVDFLCASGGSQCCGSDEECYFIQLFHDFPSMSGANCSNAAMYLNDAPSSIAPIRTVALLCHSKKRFPSYAPGQGHSRARVQQNVAAMLHTPGRRIVGCP